MKKNLGFTLAEILITMVIIGVVAALTIPTVVKNYQERVLVIRLKDTYSILTQAQNASLAKNGPIEQWDLGGSNANPTKLFNYYKPFLSLKSDCGTNTGNKACFYSGTYKALFNDVYEQQPNAINAFARCQLANGVSLQFWTSGSCNIGTCGAITADLNGKDGPNQAGVDFFRFLIVPRKGIIPDGDRTEWPCKYGNTSNKNGISCARWVIQYGNMDYRRRDISGEW